MKLIDSRCRTDGIIWWIGDAFPALLGCHFGRVDRTGRSLQYPHLRYLCDLHQQEPHRETNLVDQSSHHRRVLRGHGRYRDCFQLYWCFNGIPLRSHGTYFKIQMIRVLTSRDVSSGAQSCPSQCASHGNDVMEPEQLWEPSPDFAVPSQAG
jgi:hypothetical protein